VLDRADLKLPGGKVFTVVAEGNSTENVNVSGCFLNGAKLERNYITWEEITAGGELRFVMK
jgi:putative alpha-1,2-mannosidase